MLSFCSDLDSIGHDSLLVEDGAGPHHVVVLPQPPRRPHSEPRLEAARPRLWLLEVMVRGQGPGDGAAWRALHLLARPVFIVGVFLNIPLIINHKPGTN